MYKKTLCLTIMLLCGFNAYAKEPSRFELMDINEDKLVDYNEFSIANPNFTKMAFDIIDTDKDNKVNLEEWNAFMHKHSSPEGVKVDVEKRTKLKAKDKPDEPSLPTAPHAPTLASPSSPSEPKSSAPTTQVKEFTEDKTVHTPSMPRMQKPKRVLPVLSPREVQAPKVQSPKVESPAKVNEPKAPSVQ